MSDEATPLSEDEVLRLVAADRLVQVRVLEKFANEVASSLASLRNDIAEITRQQQIRNQGLETGDEPAPEPESDSESED